MECPGETAYRGVRHPELGKRSPVAQGVEVLQRRPTGLCVADDVWQPHGYTLARDACHRIEPWTDADAGLKDRAAHQLLRYARPRIAPWADWRVTV